jgi:hypothetical protein
MNILGALQPLPISTHVWTNISMDFSMGLPKSGNKSVIMVVFDRLSKAAHLCALASFLNFLGLHGSYL